MTVSNKNIKDKLDKGKMKKAEKITIKVLKVVERIARNEVEKTVLGRTAEFSDLSPAEKTEEKGKLGQNNEIFCGVLWL